MKNFGDKVMNGPTVYGGTGCNGDPVPPRSEFQGQVEEGEEVIVVFTRGGCFFSDKIRNGEDAGYKAVIIGNSHFGSGFGDQPDAPICGSQGSETRETASAACTGHRAMHLIFDDNPEYECQPEGCDLPPKGTEGQEVSATPQFDGWGYVRLLNADTLEEIDAYAVEESLDARFASEFGALSVHEVKTDQREGSQLGYLSYYAAGARDHVRRQGHQGGGHLHRPGRQRLLGRVPGATR